MPTTPAAPLRVAYTTAGGTMYQGTVEQLLDSSVVDTLRGRVQLLFTSPPFPLVKKKDYGNRVGDDYITWLADLAPRLRDLLTPTGSLVIEMGNAWTRGQPTMSTVGLRALLAFLERGGFHLCQQFICENPARLPGPAQWVCIERTRVTDAFTYVWWMAATERPKADNRRVLREYSRAMCDVLRKGQIRQEVHPSGHVLSARSFRTDNGGSIPSNVLRYANTAAQGAYSRHCRATDTTPHPARMPEALAEFFIKFLTDEGDLVFDPFGGSNTTGAAAERLGRRWAAVEPRADYIVGSVGRFPDPVPQLGALATPALTHGAPLP